MKQYYLNPQIGKVRYPLSIHDGKDTYRDGSPFWGIVCISNKRNLKRKIKELMAEGYVEGKP